MAGESGQDWVQLIYLFLAGMVSVAVEVIRRKVENWDDEEDERRAHRHKHHRDSDEKDHPHRRWDDPPDDDEGD